MGLFRRKQKPGSGTGGVGGPVPMGVYPGWYPNPNVLRGQADMESHSQTMILNGHDFLRVQLSNGWDRTSFGLRQNIPGGYLFAQTPFSPGLNRMQGQGYADFMPVGAAPSQWWRHWLSGPGQQPDYPGGPGYVLGDIRSPGSGA